MSDIPRAREIIEEAIRSLPVGDPTRAQIMAALPLLVRQRPMKRAAQTSRELTLQVAVEIWRYYRDHPHASTQQIATALRVNPGRVSEVLTGTRYPSARARSLRKPGT